MITKFLPISFLIQTFTSRIWSARTCLTETTVFQDEKDRGDGHGEGRLGRQRLLMPWLYTSK